MQKISVIGGGAAGLACAVMLARAGEEVTILERGERLGRKLSATGNGQGNVTNVHMDASHYFTDDPKHLARALSRFGSRETANFLSSMGGIFLPDARGRVYPAGRQASAIVDLFRRELERLGVKVIFQARVEDISYRNSFKLTYKEGTMSADKVILCAGGCAAEHFGTDGTAYALAQKFGHSLTPLRPALVRLKSDPALVKGLRGIRIDGALTVLHGAEPRFGVRGDILFTENGVSGDAVFRASSYAEKGDTLELDLLPDVSAEALRAAIGGRTGEDALLCILPNGLGRVLCRRAESLDALVSLVKAFRLPVWGGCGFREAQVTKGGIPLSETAEELESKYQKGLFLAGEILNVDGECGGYNLQWAFTSAFLAAAGVKSC